jgi:hypothetical protein
MGYLVVGQPRWGAVVQADEAQGGSYQQNGGQPQGGRIGGIDTQIHSGRSILEWKIESREREIAWVLVCKGVELPAPSSISISHLYLALPSLF